jgi:glutamine synthetase
VGRSGRTITGGQSYSIAGVNEFDELVDDIYDFSDKQGLEIDTLIHEEGPAQLEINLRHGDPVELADQVFLFKRTIREAAIKHDMYATFMAKPMQEYAGSAMHIHQSVVDAKTGKNIFSAPDGEPSEAFFNFIGGMQHYVPKALVMMAPYVNSYRRLTPDMACAGQQCLGLRQPHDRVPGAAFRTGGAAGGKPAAVVGRQFLSGAGGVAGLRLSRHGQGHRAERPGRGNRQ